MRLLKIKRLNFLVNVNGVEPKAARQRLEREDGRVGVHRLQARIVGRGVIAIDDDVACGQHLIVVGRLLQVRRPHWIHLLFRQMFSKAAESFAKVCIL